MQNDSNVFKVTMFLFNKQYIIANKVLYTKNVHTYKTTYTLLLSTPKQVAFFLVVLKKSCKLNINTILSFYTVKWIKYLCFIWWNKIAIMSHVWLWDVSEIINYDCLIREMLIYLESSFPLINFVFTIKTQTLVTHIQKIPDIIPFFSSLSVTWKRKRSSLLSDLPFPECLGYKLCIWAIQAPTLQHTCEIMRQLRVQIKICVFYCINMASCENCINRIINVFHCKILFYPILHETACNWSIFTVLMQLSSVSLFQLTSGHF